MLKNYVPLYDVSAVSSVKKINDEDHEYTFAEFNLNGKLLRYAMSSPTSHWRAGTLFTKEPGTLEWLQSFKPDDVLVDIGANVGMYSLYAAVVAGARVFAFEPESQNYAELMRSILLNAAHHKVTAFCVAIGDKPLDVSRLYLSRFSTGMSFHDFGEASRDYDAQSRFQQGCIGFSLDYLVSEGHVPAPTHIKIDVDGHENKVLAGMRQTLASGKVKTLLLECDPTLPGTKENVDSLLRSGWHLDYRQMYIAAKTVDSAEKARHKLENNKYVGNIIFARDPADLAFVDDILKRSGE